MLNRTTITEKLVTYFLLLNITAVLIIGLLSHINSKQALNKRTFEQLNSVKYVKKRQVENFFRDRINEAAFFSENAQISEIAQNLPVQTGKIKSPGFKPDKNDLNLINPVRKIFDYYSFYKRILIVKSGIGLEITRDSVYSGIDVNTRAAQIINHSDGKRNISIVELYNQSGRGLPYSLYFASRAGSDSTGGRFTLILELNTDAINSIMLETNPKEGLGNSGESYIIGNDYIMRTRSRFFPDSAFRKIYTKGCVNAVHNEEGTLIYKDYRDVDVLGSYGKLNLPGLDWFILAEIDLQESDQPIITNRNNILILTLLIAACVFILTYLLSRKITIPIVKLTEATKRISKGNYNDLVVNMSSDEIGELTNTFNELALTLKQQESELESQRQKRSQAAIEALENERLRLSRELHDGLGQSLISQKLMLEGIVLSDTERSSNILDDVKKSIDLTINEVRHICNDLMPAVLFQFGLVNAIRKLCNDLNDFSGVNIQFYSDLCQQDTVSRKTSIYLFRITQEALKNALQHSKCSKCHVELKKIPDSILLKIKDNGTGFNKLITGEGNGLINISERVNLLKGQFSLNSNKMNGTELVIKIPFENQDGKN